MPTSPPAAGSHRSWRRPTRSWRTWARGSSKLRDSSPEGLHARNPRLAILRISPFGQTGPLAGERGDDRIAQAFSGVQFTTGFPDRPPIPVALPLLDCWTGVHGANGLLMAIFHARRSGRGQVVDLGLYQIGLRVQEEVVVQHHRTGAVATRMGTESAFVVPANVYATRDGGWIAVSGAGDQPFVRLCEAVEAPDAPKDPRFATPAARLEHRADSNALVATWIARHDLAEVEARFFACGVTGTAIRSVDEIMADEHVRARGDLLSLSSETGIEFIAPAPVPKLSRTPARNPEAAPRLGEHTDVVRAGLGAIAARSRVEAIVARSPAGVAVGFGPLAGIRVLDLSQWLAGPVAATILAEFGADVIMVELPVAAPPSGSAPRPPAFRVTNRNKRSITLDVRSSAGARGLPRARAGERRHRGELPPRHARAVGPRARHSAPDQPAPRPAARLGIRPDRPVRRARRVQPGRASPSAVRRI